MEAHPSEIIKPFGWLIGKWKSVKANGKYPTIKSFAYNEELEFKIIGQILEYSSYTEDPEKKTPMHLETGYLCIKPGTNEVALMVAHNFGLTTIEEGSVNEDNLTLELKSTTISRMSFVSPPILNEVSIIQRSYKLCSDINKLEVVLYMATKNTPLSEHLRVLYIKCN